MRAQKSLVSSSWCVAQVCSSVDRLQGATLTVLPAVAEKEQSKRQPLDLQTDSHCLDLTPAQLFSLTHPHLPG